MQAIEKRSEVRAYRNHWAKAFRQGASVIGHMGGQDVLWHERLGIWGLFGATTGRGGKERDWNAFGQKDYSFRRNMIVEINQPRSGIDTNLQAIFARDAKGATWLLHQGRMSVSGARITEEDFIVATGLKPTPVRFRDGTSVPYHKVANLDDAPNSIQDAMGAFIAMCARARAFKLAEGAPLPDLNPASEWEKGFNAEAVGTYILPPRGQRIVDKKHGKVHAALVSALEELGVRYSNDRVSQYGPDLFTLGDPKVLYEIKTGISASEIFAAIGQLHIYDLLLGGGYSKVLVVPDQLKEKILAPIRTLGIKLLVFDMRARRVHFSSKAVGSSLRP